MSSVVQMRRAPLEGAAWAPAARQWKDVRGLLAIDFENVGPALNYMLPGRAVSTQMGRRFWVVARVGGHVLLRRI